MFILCKDCQQESESGNILKWVFLDSVICSKASSIALALASASLGSRTEYVINDYSSRL